MNTQAMTQDHDYQPAPAFADRRNLTVGRTRLIWAKATGPFTEGWVLPGGVRTQDFGRAMSYAVQMDALTRGAGQ
jgi:hypothetical protein